MKNYLRGIVDQAPQQERENYSHYMQIFNNKIKAPSATTTIETTNNEDKIAEHPENFNRVESLENHHANPGYFRLNSSQCSGSNQGILFY